MPDARVRTVTDRTALSDLWWKNAVVYCLDVDSFLDTNGDGTGDLAGVYAQLDYLAGLGVTCLWLQPFYPSPDRDNGYDISDYLSVDGRFGTVADVVELVRAAAERGIRVIADLVVNHTSIDHPWFQAAGDRESEYHDYYVWSDERPPDAEDGIIFPGQQESVWSYDKRVDRWYMHRFYPHQPDLNINNERVRQDIHKVMGFWLQLGISGFRVDAVPFLIEQEGQASPAVADPHDYLRDMRAFLARRRGDAILLAEANEPAERLGAYFGDDLGDQMHVLFDFIGNQALYLALARGDARPIADALEARPSTPPGAQWAVFVRNHDELTLDKLTDEEREEAFAAFAPDPDMRLFGRGIRRRFPPMVGGDRARIELAYSLAFSLPGTPVLFYGEEIGMGDDQALGGRDAVRTAMQWSSGPGAGFSTAARPAIPRPPVEGGRFGYERVNVERQREQPSSLLNWFERLIRTRKAWPEIGFGDWRVVPAGDDALLAHILSWAGGDVVAIHNLAERPARARLTLPEGLGDLPWRHLLGSGRREDAPKVEDGVIDESLPGFAWHWYGRRERP
jgi:trehalose synthase